MSKMLRWLLVPLLVIATRFPLYAQEEKKEAEATETQTKKPVTQQEAITPKDEVIEDEAVEAEEVAVPEDEIEFEMIEDAPEPEVEAEEAPTKEAEEEPVVEPEEVAEEVIEDEPVESPKWDEDVEAPEASPEAVQGELGEDEIMGIDTVDLADPQGNWLYKRVWWERAEAKYEKIREVVNKVLEVRSGFFAKRAELDKNVLDPFYIKIGISQGELQEILKELIAKVETLLADAKSERILEKAEADKTSLQDLQKKVDQVMAQDEEVENAMVMLVDQISKIRNIEQQAWQDFKNIARVLDDRKARELFYKVDAAWRNIKDLKQYVEQTFAGRFDNLIAKVKEDIKRVDQEVSAIKESGIDLKQRLLSAQRVQMEEEEQEEEEAPKGIFTRFIIDPIKGIFSGVWSVITWPYYKLFGAPVEVEEDEEEMEEPETVEEEVVTEEVTATEEAQPEAAVEEEVEVDVEAEEMPEDDFEVEDIEDMEELDDQA